MSIKVNKGTSQEAIEFNKIHLNKFVLEKELLDSSKMNVRLRTYLTGTSDSGEWACDKDSKWDKDIVDFEAYAIKMYCSQTGSTVSEAMLVYQEALKNVNSTNILDIMAHFQKGIALIYDFENDKESEVE